MLARAARPDIDGPELFRLALLVRQSGTVAPNELQTFFSEILKQARLLADRKFAANESPLPEAVQLAYEWAINDTLRKAFDGKNSLSDIGEDEAKVILEELGNKVEAFY